MNVQPTVVATGATGAVVSVGQPIPTTVVAGAGGVPQQVAAGVLSPQAVAMRTAAAQARARQQQGDLWKRLEDMISTMDELRANVTQCFAILAQLLHNPENLNEARASYKIIMHFIKHQFNKLDEFIAAFASSKLTSRSNQTQLASERSTINLRSSLRKKATLQQQTRERQHIASSTFDTFLRTRFPTLEPPPKRLKVGPNEDDYVETKITDINTIIDTSISDQRIPKGMIVTKTEWGVMATITGVFIASVSCGKTIGAERLLIDGVSICGLQEEPGMWTRTQSKLFQKITENAVDVVHHYSRIHPDMALRSLLLWLGYYQDLWSAPCRGCNKHLYYDSTAYQFLPPSFRALDSGWAYHPQCYQAAKI
eukprot:TRINITY_DN2563_c0_g1_i1.p1 TRINITY_DN2563_c0_g1~~TRINITY_DN2563_c0_g1_i1.p1  ORF type:complete len:368 (-),score=76.88 TRINITY_DN2563_c0_g1_i1:115-1218(-)